MELAEGTVEIKAPLEEIVEVIEDYESYPELHARLRVRARRRGGLVGVS
jgi:hypothetical protein